METLAIAASGEGCQAEFKLRDSSPEDQPIIDVKLVRSKRVVASDLLPFTKVRVTQRSPFSVKPLSGDQKQVLETAVGDGYQVIWLESREKRWNMAKLPFKNALIRLTIPEAYEVHKRVIEWDAQFSDDRIPDQAVGADPVTLKLMKWAMASWGRVEMN